MRNSIPRTRSKSFVLTILAMICVLMLGTLSVFADTKAEATQDEQAKRNLTTYVYGQMSQNEYEVDGGGSLAGSDLFEGSPTDGYDLQEDEFQSLTSAAQTQVVEDIADNSYDAIDSDKADGVTESTVQNWWKELQTKNGVGSKFMNEILKNTKPDFVTANAIYQPFSGVVGTILGLLAILICAFLGIVMAADICYITLPPVRNFVAEDDSSKGKIAKSKMFSHDAIYAVQCAEDTSDGGSGGGRQALGIYLKRRIFALVLLGICLLYLVNGALYSFVSMILDLLNGFLGF
mgnify:FL=1